jgi:hypothetical protein
MRAAILVRELLGKIKMGDEGGAGGVEGVVSKSAAISTLVQQLRDGVISRAQLFDKLTRLHRGEGVDLGSGGLEGGSGGGETGEVGVGHGVAALPMGPADGEGPSSFHLCVQLSACWCCMQMCGVGVGGGSGLVRQAGGGRAGIWKACVAATMSFAEV